MSEMVERVAYRLASYELASGNMTEEEWKSSVYDDLRDDYLAQARIAIKAMREPTIAMCKVSSFEMHEIGWPAMIDEALR